LRARIEFCSSTVPESFSIHRAAVVGHDVVGDRTVVDVNGTAAIVSDPAAEADLETRRH
jgi:hypothetical protein